MPKLRCARLRASLPVHDRMGGSPCWGQMLSGRGNHSGIRRRAHAKSRDAHESFPVNDWWAFGFSAGCWCCPDGNGALGYVGWLASVARPSGRTCVTPGVRSVGSFQRIPGRWRPGRRETTCWDTSLPAGSRCCPAWGGHAEICTH